MLTKINLDKKVFYYFDNEAKKKCIKAQFLIEMCDFFRAVYPPFTDFISSPYLGNP
jgi:hypothetical protein